jgi:ABC-2 type transport system ATP-binding protein
VLSATSISYTWAKGTRSATQALRNVSFVAGAGRITAVVGPNGSGKSTLFRILSGAMRADAGEVRLEGNGAVPPGLLGVVFQTPALDDMLSVRENILHHALLYGKREREGVQDTAFLHTLGIADLLDARVATLSGGFRRRVEIAKALATAPRVLVLDEPFNGLDPQVREDVFALLRTLTRERSLVTVMVTHDMAQASRCDSVVALRDGQVITQDTPEALLREFGDTVVEIATTDVDALAETLRGVGRRYLLREGRLLLGGAGMVALLERLGERHPLVEHMEWRRANLDDWFVARPLDVVEHAGEVLAA